jgi:hypothetical protein
MKLKNWVIMALAVLAVIVILSLIVGSVHSDPFDSDVTYNSTLKIGGTQYYIYDVEDTDDLISRIVSPSTYSSIIVPDPSPFMHEEPLDSGNWFGETFSYTWPTPRAEVRIGLRKDKVDAHDQTFDVFDFQNGKTTYDDDWTIPHKDPTSPTNLTYGVGGIVIPVDKFSLLAPYIGLASTVLVATAVVAVCIKRVRCRKEKQ